ncbi:MAG: DevB secretion protein [Cyanobium sp. CACIAM 14]|nr:MAG: DevB secretion protein [Cyanobium sp. CACIAM 14]
MTDTPRVDRLDGLQRLRRQAWGSRRRKVVTVSLLAVLGLASWQLSHRPAPPPPPLAPRAVTALGRLTPRGGVVPLSTASGNSGGSEVVAKWLVPEGAIIRRGQLLGILSSWASLREGVLQAETQLALSEAKLAQVDAGTRQGARLKAEADLRAEQVLIPYLRISREKSVELFKAGAISEEELGKADAALARSKANVLALKGTLEDSLTVRPVDREVALAELSVSRATLAQARSQLRNAEIRSPLDGRLLRIYSWPGMKETDQGLAQIGQVGAMQVWAQVFQSDVPRIRRGQPVEVWAESGGFSGRLKGTVQEITGEVSARDLFSVNSNNNVNARVVLVKIDLSPGDSSRLARLSGLNVNVRFLP